MTLKDGTVVSGDLVIGADGIHSVSVTTILGRPNPPQPAQHSNCCYRFLIPRDDVENDPETSFFTKKLVGRQGLRIWPDAANARRLVYYPCREYGDPFHRTSKITIKTANCSFPSSQVLNFTIMCRNDELGLNKEGENTHIARILFSVLCASGDTDPNTSPRLEYSRREGRGLGSTRRL